MPQDYRFTSRLAPLSGGDKGSVETLRIVKRLAHADAKTPELWRLSRLLTQDVLSYDNQAEAEALQRFVRDEIQYRRDIAGTETVQSPRTTLRISCGDCDDKTALAAALLVSIGFPVRFVLARCNRRSPGLFSHIYPETVVAGRWTPVETIVPGRPLGWAPPQYGPPYREA